MGWGTPPEIIRKRDSLFSAMRRHDIVLGQTLNVGSKDTRFGDSCTNLDIEAGGGVDVVGDAHDLSRLFAPAAFDTVVLSAVLQYCRSPASVVKQASDVLRPGGWLVIDAPFLQPYCYDRHDLWRFTADGLRQLCQPPLEVKEVTVSIGAGPAAAFTLQAMAQRWSNKYLAAAAAWTATIALWPLRYIPGSAEQCAGAFLLVARKSA